VPGGGEAILYVRDLERVAGFYEACLGLRRVEAGEGYCGLDAGFTLWLVQGEESSTPKHAPTSPPRRRSQVPVKLCFTVRNLNAIRSVIADAGGQFDEHVWTFGGYHRCDAVDPEGNIIQVLQLLGPSDPASPAGPEST
jgi:predicted enzyme related to lactoylglutathione lyase